MGEIRLHELTRVYPRGVRALDGFTLDIADGELVVVAGPSGAGKTTLLRVIAGLEPATRGDVAIDGKLVNRVAPAKRDIAMVFQDQALYPHMTVFANMAYALSNRGVRRSEAGERVRQTAELMGLTPLLGRRPHALSAGERQRVALARAIVRAPQAFLLDEPLTGLDGGERDRLRTEIATLQRRLGVTMVYVTHSESEAMTLADRLVVMNAGRIEQAGPPLELYDRPDNPFVAGFLGTPAMNLLPAEVGAMTGAIHLDREASIPGEFGALAKHGDGRIVLGVRPEHVTRAAGHDDNALRGEVASVEHRGPESIVRVRIARNVSLTMRLAGRPGLSPGDVTSLAIDPAHMHFFDRESGARIETDQSG